MNFISDNAYGAAPEILEALEKVNDGAVAPYGEDEITAQTVDRLSELFERKVAAFPVLTGTAANALALGTITPSYGAIFCHEESHLAVDECGAPEFFSGGARLVQLKGNGAKITPDEVSRHLPLYRRGVHGSQPAAISIAQATEYGLAYTPPEISALADLAHREGMALHMDGARFANALAYLGGTPAEVTWKAGVDVMSFGATKNGALCAEAVVFFNEDLVRDFEYRRKRAGHLLSKMRFVSAQLNAYLADGRWLDWARRANGVARRLAQELGQIPGVELTFPVEANEVFARMPDELIARLRGEGAQFYDWSESQDGRKVVRLVLSCLTPAEDISRFLAVARKRPD